MYVSTASPFLQCLISISIGYCVSNRMPASHCLFIHSQISRCECMCMMKADMIQWSEKNVPCLSFFCDRRHHNGCVQVYWEWWPKRGRCSVVYFICIHTLQILYILSLKKGRAKNPQNNRKGVHGISNWEPTIWFGFWVHWWAGNCLCWVHCAPKNGHVAPPSTTLLYWPLCFGLLACACMHLSLKYLSSPALKNSMTDHVS